MLGSWIGAALAQLIARAIVASARCASLDGARPIDVIRPCQVVRHAVPLAADRPLALALGKIAAKSLPDCDFGWPGALAAIPAQARGGITAKSSTTAPVLVGATPRGERSAAAALDTIARARAHLREQLLSLIRAHRSRLRLIVDRLLETVQAQYREHVGLSARAELPAFTDCLAIPSYLTHDQSAAGK